MMRTHLGRGREGNDSAVGIRDGAMSGGSGLALAVFADHPGEDGEAGANEEEVECEREVVGGHFAHPF